MKTPLLAVGSVCNIEQAASSREGEMKQHLAQAAPRAICLPLAGMHCTDTALVANVWTPGCSSQGRVPRYLLAHYWWAYVHPNAVKLFERQWLVNLILWGNYNRLRRAVLAEMAPALDGRSLQVACAYGDLTKHLAQGIAASGGLLDVIDVLPIQLHNLQEKLPKNAPVRLLAMDSTKLILPDASYDQALVFFLLHEQPSAYREQTMSEVFRVVKPGGKIILVDYALPRSWHPLRYLWRPLLAHLEPFALDLWRNEITRWFPRIGMRRLRKATFFGGLYQKVVITR